MLAVEMRGITKRFGTLIANDGVNFELEQGEIHALLGENGAGKTTLMRMLYGLYHHDAGEILVNGQPAVIRSPRDAIHLGIGMVTQHFTLVPTLTVAENLVLGEEGKMTLSPREIEARVGAASERYGVQVNPGALVRHLSVGERQRVEILKALYRQARVLILDEPTAVLVPQEVDVLFEALLRLRKEGLSVVFISHKLNEVMAICDRITVLRTGKAAGTVLKTNTSPRELATMMVGKEEFGVTRQGEREKGAALLQISGLKAVDKKGLPALRDVTFDVYAGEVLGVAGVSGNGQTELGQVLAGTLKPTSGSVRVDGQDVTGAEPSRMMAAGVGRIPEDRHANVVGDMSVADNMVLDQLADFTRGGVLDRAAIHKNAEALIAQYHIKATPEVRIRTLSGGNMQKVILARTLSRNPKVVVASQPTRGLDVGATDYVRARLLEQRDRGAGVLLVSEDLDEVLALSDRVAVIYEGQIMGILNAQDATRERVGLLMAGTRLEEKEVQVG